MSYAMEYEEPVDWELEGNPAKIVVRQAGEVHLDPYDDGKPCDVDWDPFYVWVGNDLLTDWSKVSGDEHAGFKEQISQAIERGQKRALDNCVASLPDWGPDDDGD